MHAATLYAAYAGSIIRGDLSDPVESFNALAESERNAWQAVADAFEKSESKEA